MLDRLFFHRLPRRQHNYSRGNALGLGQEQALIGLKRAVGLHFVAAGPEVFSGNDVFLVGRFDDLVSVSRASHRFTAITTYCLLQSPSWVFVAESYPLECICGDENVTAPEGDGGSCEKDGFEALQSTGKLGALEISAGRFCPIRPAQAALIAGRFEIFVI